MWEYLGKLGYCRMFREIGTKKAFALDDDEFEELMRLNPGITRFGGDVSPGVYFVVNKGFME